MESQQIIAKLPVKDSKSNLLQGLSFCEWCGQAGDRVRRRCLLPPSCPPSLSFSHVPLILSLLERGSQLLPAQSVHMSLFSLDDRAVSEYNLLILLCKSLYPLKSRSMKEIPGYLSFFCPLPDHPTLPPWVPLGVSDC